MCVKYRKNLVQYVRAFNFLTITSTTGITQVVTNGVYNARINVESLSQTGTFEAFFDALANLSETAHLVQMFDSTIVRAHVSAAGAKGGRTRKLLADRAAASRRKSI